MAIRGAEAKQKVMSQILETFSGSFLYEKEIRIPILENGETVQVKCVLTAAKTNVAPDGDAAVPGVAAPAGEWNFDSPMATTPTPAKPQVSEEEAKNIENLLKKFGF